MSIKQRAYNIILSRSGSVASLWFQIFMCTLIILNVIAAILESVEQVGIIYYGAFYRFEWFSVSIFAVEYLTRVWISNLTPGHQESMIKRLRYILSPMAIIDLLAMLPFLLAIAGVDLRALWLLRIFRLLKLTNYSKAAHSITSAIKSSWNEIVVSLFIMFFLIIICATLIYFAEHDAQPESFSSIPASLWWAVVTLTTIGYGDMFPITIVGKIIAGIAAILGIGMFALPGGIIASQLIANARKGGDPTCPHCGKKLRHDND
ncbi:MAG: ion transporter [Candidatus Nitrotoga sp.]|nr:ion transporter [Candidatus Nitrotoga sp.]MBP0118152.1 ion transporter [Candidatus Nitrotoga sp.]